MYRNLQKLITRSDIPRPTPAASLCLLLLLSPSCTDRSTCDLPAYEVGAVEGYVLAGGEGRSITVGARPREGERRGAVIASTLSDSTGWFRLELPTGLYRLETNPVSGMYSTGDVRDTITITPHVQHYDLLRGQLQVRIRMPGELNGESFKLSIRSPHTYDSDSQTLQVQDGLLDFHFPVLYPQSYTLELEPAGSTQGLYLPGTYDPDEAETVEIGAEEPVIIETSFEQSYASISGSITGSWQQASVDRPEVNAYSADSIRIARAWCEDDGTFTLPLFIAEPVRLLTECQGLEQWVGGATYEEAQVFSLGPGDRITGVSVVESGLNVWLEGPGTLTYHRASIRLIDAAGHTFEPNNYSDNPITICNLPPGEYRLLVYGYCKGEPWANQWYDGAESASAATPITLAPGELRTVTIHLVEGGRIQGRVLDSDGQPRDDYDLRLCDADGETLCEQWQSRTRGEFSYSGLANGDYYLAVRTTWGGETCWYPGMREFEYATPIRIRDYGTVTGIEWIAGGEEEVAP
jgi:hypothetical protein